jgi:hypothetical protein
MNNTTNTGHINCGRIDPFTGEARAYGRCFVCDFKEKSARDKAARDAREVALWVDLDAGREAP